MNGNSVLAGICQVYLVMASTGLTFTFRAIVFGPVSGKLSIIGPGTVVQFETTGFWVRRFVRIPGPDCLLMRMEWDVRIRRTGVWAMPLLVPGFLIRKRSPG